MSKILRPVPFPEAVTQGDDIDHVQLIDKAVRRNMSCSPTMYFKLLLTIICSIECIALTRKISTNMK